MGRRGIGGVGGRGEGISKVSISIIFTEGIKNGYAVGIECKGARVQADCSLVVSV